MTDQAAEARELLSDANLDATRETLAAWVDEYPQLRGLLRTWDALSARLAQAEEALRDAEDEWGEAHEHERQRALQAEARLREYEEALEEIAKSGPVFDAKGTWSKRVCDKARAALAGGTDG